MAANAIVVTGKIGPGDTITAQRLNAQAGITFNANGTVSINGQVIDISAATGISVAVTAGSGHTPPVFVFTIT